MYGISGMLRTKLWLELYSLSLSNQYVVLQS